MLTDPWYPLTGDAAIALQMAGSGLFGEVVIEILAVALNSPVI
jgi:hypothetical protein